MREVEPRVWRRLLVPGSVRLDKLHRVFQAAMGWEDCHVGGSWGYEHLLTVLADPSHEEHEHQIQWVGGSFDPTAFDLALVNAHVQAVR